MTDIVLLTPPSEMRQACCAGLNAREAAGKGGTARSVPFASRVCAGGPVTRDDLVDMLTHMAAIAEAMIERGLGDKALAIAWDLWGGDPGREWAEAFVYRPTPVMAAAAAAPPAAPAVELPWLDALNALARGERELLARIHELMEAGVEIAVNRLRHKVVNGLQRPSAALKAAFSGLHHRDQLLAAIAAAEDDVAAVRCLPSPILARLAPGIESDEKLRAVFGQLGQRVVALIGEHQQKVIGVLRDAGASTVHLSECSTLMAADLSMAVDMATAELMDLIARLARDEATDPEGELPTGRVASSLAFRLLSAAGGGDPGDGNRQDWVHLGQGEVLAAGVALGVTSLRFLGRAIQAGSIQAAVGTLTVDRVPTLDVVTVTTWHWGGSSRPFPPHQQLHGQSWSTEQERADVCVNTGRFPSVAAFYPGDHRGCSCSFEVELRIVQTAKGSATVAVERPQLRAAAPSLDMGPGWQAAAPRALSLGDLAYLDAAAKERVLSMVGKSTERWLTTAGNGVPITVDVMADTAKFLPENVRVLTDTVRDLVERNPPPVGAFEVRIAPMNKGVGGYSVAGSGRITVNVEMLEQGLDRDVQSFTPWVSEFGDGLTAKTYKAGNPAGTELARTLTHEYGHAIDNHVARGIPEDFWLDEDEELGQQGGPLGRSWLAEISGYATTNTNEGIAEAFVDWLWRGSQAPPATRLIADFMGWR